jgi:hypothetical protein
MRNLPILLLVTVLAGPVAAQSVHAKGSFAASPVGRGDNLGVGLYLGQPSGITVNYWISPELAVSGIIGSWLHPATGGVLGARLLYDVRDLAGDVQTLEVSLYFGVGAGVGWLEEDGWHEHSDPWPHRHSHPYREPLVYLQPAVGGQLLFRKIPVEIFLELSPALMLTPGPDLEAAGGLGGRFYF